MYLADNVNLNIPYEYWDISKFRATLSHKVNHSFTKTNCAFILVFHPRYGTVRGVEATRNISKGEEILVNYGYGFDTLNPKWFYEVYVQEVGPLPDEARKMYEEQWGKMEIENMKESSE